MAKAADNRVLSPTTLLDFLASEKNDLDDQIFTERLNELTTKVLADSFCTAFHMLLHQNGWDDSIASFVRAELNVETLATSLGLYIERMEKRDTSTRNSQGDMKNQIKSFAPDMLMTYSLERQFDLRTTKIEPFSAFFEGVCLLADISGFTRLSGKFCEAGKDGIDQLQGVVNGYLGQLVKIVYAYGGDVMKFAGDALVCVFQPSRYFVSGKEMTIADACSNAVQCATELAQICTAQLTIHVAVSCGPICFAILGGHDDIWECLVSGQCLGHLSQCLEDAGSKQTVVSPQLIEKLGLYHIKELNIEQLSSGNYRVISAGKINPLAVRQRIKRRGEILMKDSESRFAMFPNGGQFLAVIGLFVPMPVTVGLSSGTFDYLAELREVTTMFMSWDTYNEELHQDLLSLQNIFLAAQKTLILSGGFIRQFLIDDKGCVLIACWGVPTASHPDNARRALCAGAIIGYELNELGMKTSVGITTGNVFCGCVGSHVRREYAVIGDVVNLAARLMSKAKGGLYLDEATFSRIPIYLQQYLQMLAPMAIKGKDRPVAAYSLKKGMRRISLSDKGEGEINIEILSVRPHCKSPLTKLMQMISNKMSCQLDCVLLEGKVGTGKVEVVDWLKLTGPRMDIRVIHYSVLLKDTDTSYDLVAKLFRLLVREAIFDDLVALDIVVKRIFQSLYRDDTETIEKVAYPAARLALGIKSESTRRLPKSVLQECLKEIFYHLFSLFPLIIVIENINTADYLSIEILIKLIGSSCYGLIVMTMEPLEDIRTLLFDQDDSNHIPSLKEEIKNNETLSLESLIFSKLCVNYKRIIQSPFTLLIPLNDYSVLDIDQLLCNVLKLEVCPDLVSSNVHQLSGGDPFWCRELAQFIEITGASEFVRAMVTCRDLEYLEAREVSGVVRLLSTKNQSKMKTIDREEYIRTANESLAVSPRFAMSSPSSYSYPHRGTVDHGKIGGTGAGGGGGGSLLTQASRFFRHSSLPINDSEHHNPKTETIAKLELLIVSRLETLSREDQNILRTASIIGRKFTREILYGILPPKMRTQMFCSIISMINSHWIVESVYKSSSSISLSSSSSPLSYRTHNGEFESIEYSFAHPLFYQTLYDLTPASDKARLHYSVAKHIEESYEGNPIHYARLGRHYGVAKDCRSKALEYYAKAAIYSLSDHVSSHEQCLEFLNKAKNYADTAMDYGSILGIIVTGKENLNLLQKIFVQTIEETTSVKSITSWDSLRNQQNLFRFKKNRIDISPLRGKDNLTNKINSNLKIENVDYLLDLFHDVEDEINLLYDEMVTINCVGIVYPWQTSYLKKWKTYSSDDEKILMREEFLSENSTRSLNLSNEKINIKSGI